MSFIGIVTNSKNEESMVKKIFKLFPADNIIFITSKNIDNIRNIQFETVVINGNIKDDVKLKNIINTSVNEGLFLRLDNIIENVNLGDAVVLRAFKNNPKYIQFLHNNSYWYKKLNRSSKNFAEFENDVKDKMQLRITDKISEVASAIDMLTTFLSKMK